MTDAEFPADVAALLDGGADAAEVIAAVRALAGERGHGILKKETTTHDRVNMKCTSGWESKTCVHIEFENGDVLDRCSPWRCQ